MNRMTPVRKGQYSLYNMIDDFFGDNLSAQQNVLASSFKVDVKEEENAYLVEAEMPGIQKENIDISLHKGEMAISVRHEEEKVEEKTNYIHRERRASSMCRRLYLGDVDEENISAKLEHGILSISVPKKVIPERKMISIE